MYKKIICILCMIFAIVMTGCEGAKSPEYVYEDVEIAGTVIKQYIVDDTHKNCNGVIQTKHEYYTIVDYGGEYLKEIEDKEYYQRHNVGDEVTLIKHRKYTIDGEWVCTEVYVKGKK